MPIGVDSRLADILARGRFAGREVERHVVAAISRNDAIDIVLSRNNVDGSLEGGI